MIGSFSIKRTEAYRIGGLVIVILIVIFATRAYMEKSDTEREYACTMDALICPDGTAVGRTGPHCEFAPCPNSEVTPAPEEPASIPDLITVTSPNPGARVASPLTIEGEARGYWFFEASFPIVITDWDGKIIGEGYAEAQGDWMTENFVPFIATVNFTVPPNTPYRRGTLILKKDNPSGMPENDRALEIPITF